MSPVEIENSLYSELSSLYVFNYSLTISSPPFVPPLSALSLSKDQEGRGEVEAEVLTKETEKWAVTFPN